MKQRPCDLVLAVNSFGSKTLGWLVVVVWGEGLWEYLLYWFILIFFLCFWQECEKDAY